MSKYNTMEHNDIILYNFGLSHISQIVNVEINSYNYENKGLIPKNMSHKIIFLHTNFRLFLIII